MSDALIIEYYTDILCIWAWISQRRIDELTEQLGDKVLIKHHYIDLFGDVQTKMDTQWSSRGGYEGFAEHVQLSAARFKHVDVHPQLWIKTKPVSSANAHLILKAVELAYGANQSAASALQLRTAFFKHAENIGSQQAIYKVLDDNGLDCQKVETHVIDGTAIALLQRDYQQAHKENVKGSPSYVMDGGRHILYGNVGYRAIRTNIDEILKHPQDEASWC